MMVCSESDESLESSVGTAAVACTGKDRHCRKIDRDRSMER
jgi:hypothetical protein